MSGDDETVSNRRTYDRIAGDYLARQQVHRSGPGAGFAGFADFEAKFLATLPRGARVADLGCGPALDAAGFGQKGYQPVGVDLSVGMLRMAPPVMHGRLAQGDLRGLPVGNGRLDGIWSCAALLHVPLRDTATVLKEFRRALRAGGHLGLITALGHGARYEDVGYVPNERRWFVYRERSSVVSSVARAGFAIVSEERIDGNRAWLAVLGRAVQPAPRLPPESG